MRVVHVKKAEGVPTGMIDGRPTLVYWDITGLAQTIRLALVAAGVDFVDVRIDAGPSEHDDYKKVWFDAKKNLLSKPDLHFPNLPYYCDDKVAFLTQSDSILRHVGRSYNLMNGDLAKIDQALDQLKDLESTFVRLFYGMGPDAIAKWLKTDVPAILKQWSNYISKTDFVAGDELTVADLKLYNFLYKVRICRDEILGSEQYSDLIPNKLVAFLAKIEDFPRVKEYMSSPNYLKRPLNNPEAKFK